MPEKENLSVSGPVCLEILHRDRRLVGSSREQQVRDYLHQTTQDKTLGSEI